MGETERVHPIRMRGGGIEYFVETSCPDCGAAVFKPRYGKEDEIYGDLDMFAPHQCPIPVPPAPVGFPVDLGRIPPEQAAEFRAMVESPFGKPLRRFVGAMKKPGLPVHFVGEWMPFLGHVRSFSKSDVHRPLDRECPVLKEVIPVLMEHFSRLSGTRHRKYYIAARGVYKAERSRNLPVIKWRWPARY